jgi:hypothetical protein
MDAPALRPSFSSPMANIGVFYAFHQPPVVPDMFLSLDVAPPADLWKKTSRSYFIWE